MCKKLITAVFAAVGTSLFAATPPQFVQNEAVFWLDASTLTQLPGQGVDTWSDVRGEGYPVATTSRGVNPVMTSASQSSRAAGKPAVDFGPIGNNCDMKFAETQRNVVTVFFVMEIDQVKCACLLGGPDGGAQRFCRESANSYASGKGQTGNYSIWTNGEQVADPLTTPPPSKYNLIVYRCDDASNLPTVKFLASDRDINGRHGGKRLCEVIALPRVLTDEERLCVEEYLRKKWFEEAWSWADKLSVNELLALAQVHFDASVATSFRTEGEGGSNVVQWDDLSGNNNHFIAHINQDLGLTGYGTVGSLAGCPVFDSGAEAGGIDLKLTTRMTDTRAVVMVADIDDSSQVFWLGDSKDYTFHRGNNGSYFYVWDWNYPAPEAGGSPWCNGKAVASRNDKPTKPGALSVYVFNMPQKSSWNYLGQDRSSRGRHGGKRVAELFTFDFELPDVARQRIENHLFDKWSPPADYIDSIAAVHVDASSPDNFVYSNGHLTGWKNTGLGADLFYYPHGYLNDSQYNMNYGSYGITNGVPAFLMGTCASDVDLAFERLTNIRAVYWVMDIQRNAKAFFLGDPRMTANQGGEYHFHRGTAGQYAGNYDNGFARGEVACDGTPVNVTSDYPPHGLHVYEASLSKDCTAAALSGDRWCDHRNGGRAISECIIFTNEVWGLTRIGVRKRLENKWTRQCGWAGVGDPDWGADKYRVFGENTTVPADGAAANGIGFTADLTLDGGTLAIGKAGFFANEDVTATITAAVSGDVGVYGAGTVLFASARTLSSVTVGCNSKIALAPGSAIDGTLTLLKGAKLVIDGSNLAAKQYAEIALNGTINLPEGGDFVSYVTVMGGNHVFTVSDDGKKLLINDRVPVRAVWKGGAEAFNSSAWICYAEDGDVVANAVPGVHVKNMTLEADADFSNLGPIKFGDGLVIDLKGYTLEGADLSNAKFPAVEIINTEETTATLVVTVARGKTINDATATIRGNIKFVKSGEGTFISSCAQYYTGGTEVREGSLNAEREAEGNLFGIPAPDAEVSEIVVLPGAVFDIAQRCGWGGYKMILAGGTLQNSRGGFDDGHGGMFTNIVITAEGSVLNTVGIAPWGIFGNGTDKSGYPPTSLDLGDHDLTINVSWFFKFCNTTVTGDGKITVKGRDNLFLGVKGRAHANGDILAKTVDFSIETPLRVYAPFHVRSYEAACNSASAVAGDSSEEIKVFGSFIPAEHNVFYGCTMMPGSTIDLKNRSGDGLIPFHLTCAMTGDSQNSPFKSVRFVKDSKVTVDVSALKLRRLVNNYLLTWDADAAPDRSVKFTIDELSNKRGYALRKDDNGLKLISAGLKIFVR
jgi:hypothetical protein